MSGEKPNYYSIITAEVRYDNDLTDSEKLLFSELTALANKDGFCWSSNNYFAKLYNVTKKTISRRLKHLEDKGYIKRELIRNEDKQVIKRKIYTIKGIGYRQNIPEGMDNKAKGNNTSNNNTSTNSSSNSCSDKSPNEKSGDDEPKFDEDSEPYKAAVYLRRKINANHPKQPTPNENPKDLQDWAVELDRLNRLGTVGAKDKGYSWEEIYEIMMWCQDHHFWKNNIMSAYKFRKQIVQLEAKMKANKEDNNGKEKVSGDNQTEEEREYGEEVNNYFQF